MTQHRPPVSLVSVLTLVLVTVGSRASAEPTGCKRAVEKASVKFALTKFRALQRCEDGRLTGKITVPCPDTKTTTAIDKAEAKLRSSIAGKCGGPDRTCGAGGDDDGLATIGWNIGTCPNFENGGCANAITECTGVSACVSCVDEAAIDQAMDLYYDDLTPSTDGTVTRCQREIGRNAGKFFAAKLKALGKCEDRVLAGTSPGPCPDGSSAAKIASAAAKAAAKICKTCGGADGACGGGDDLTPATIGFAASCPAVTVPGGPACGGPVVSLQDLVTCVSCVTEFKADCLEAVGAPAAKLYPAECNFGVSPTATPTPGGPTRTPTPGGGGPTATPTPPSNCGNSTVNPGEDCDGSDSAACPGLCTAMCTCPPACVLPNPLPAIVSFASRPGSELDTGWTGIAHDVETVDDAVFTAARLSSCDLSTASATCGQCDLDGPVAFPGQAKNCFCTNLGNPDGSSLAVCDPEQPSDCSNPEACQCYLGPPLPISAGSVPVCVVNRYAGPVTGTANIADAGPQAGTGAVVVRLASLVHTGIANNRPCPTCEGDATPRDGVRNGACNGGAHDGQPCDVAGANVLFGAVSHDCQPASSSNVGNLSITFDPATTGTTQLATGPRCTATGFTNVNCFCDTCATALGEPCNSNADCPGGAVCGARRCIGGTNNGIACAAASECPGGGFCQRPGTSTAPNQCMDGTCSPEAGDPGEGICESGPLDRVCSLETFRGCTADADCNPAPSGNCVDCLPNQICDARLRECFLDPIVRAGTPHPQVPVIAATFCIPPTSSQSVNQTAGLPGPGALALPLRVFRTASQCGNGVLNGGEQCDPPADTACPGACQLDCSCPTCGDGVVNQASEQCDGNDDGACPGSCQANCTCGGGTCGNDVVEFGEECDGTSDAACPGACQGDCTCGPFCGNGVVDAGEQCDGAASAMCPPSACQANCACGPFCGNGTIDPGEECDGTGQGVCPGTCDGDCTCSPVCGDNQRQGGELCDGTDDAVCPGQCTSVCTCPGQGTLTLTVVPGADLDTGWTGTAHDFQVQTGSRISGELSGCDGQTDFACDFFGNVGSFCSADPSRACTNDNQCSGAGSCVISTFGPPLPLSAGGVPACIVNRFATDVTGTYSLQTGASELFVHLNSLVHLGNAVSAPCPVCDCGAADVHDCQIGQSGTCTGILGSPPCTVQGTGPFGPTSNDCPPSASLNVSGGGLDIPFTPITTGTVTFPSNQACDGPGFQGQQCWCDGQPQPSQCATACDGGSNDGLPCDSDANCPGAPAGACRPLCRQITGEAVGEGQCVAGPVVQTCAGAHEIGCQTTSDCPSGKGPCQAANQRCFIDPIVRVGTPGTVINTGVAAFCIPATTGQAINQTAGLPGPGSIVLPTSVNAALCGDGVVNQTREECDRTADANCPGACQPNCTCSRTCGNGDKEFGEQCDPGGPGGSPAPDDAACPGNCVAAGSAAECTCPPVCGDGFVGPGEQCDPGGTGGNPPPSDAVCPGTCLAGSCQCPLPPLPQCGNGTLDAGEACDLPAVGCGPLQACLLCSQCFPPPDVIPPETGFICGNGNIEPTETCEVPAIGCGDGQLCNPTNCTECIDVPVSPVCGNLNIEAGEACELPAIGCGAGEVCLLCDQCVPFVPVCGNLNLEPGEACELPARGCGPLQVCLLCQQCVP